MCKSVSRHIAVTFRMNNFEHVRVLVLVILGLKSLVFTDVFTIFDHSSLFLYSALLCIYYSIDGITVLIDL